MIEFSAGIDPLQGYLLAGLCGLLVGLSKTGLPGAGMIAVTVLAFIMDAKTSVGFLLPLLVTGDIIAVIMYRHNVVWSQLVRLIPWALVGILIGYHLMGMMSSNILRPLIGIIVLTLLSLDLYVHHLSKPVPTGRWYLAAITGITAGIATMLANAAGPIITVYFLAMRFNKRNFIGTSAWYFLVLNFIKIPFFICLDPPLITKTSLMANFTLIPCILVGALTGAFLLKRISQKWFTMIVRILTLIAAVRLLT